MDIKHKNSKMKQMEADEDDKVVVSEEFDKLSKLVHESLTAFREMIEDCSMKEMKRILISTVESPLENTVYKTNKQAEEQFPSHTEESAAKLARAIKFWQFQMFFENLKNPDKVEEMKEKVA